jgi:ABC-type branched-subunit amino acid transport system ATPase component
VLSGCLLALIIFGLHWFYGRGKRRRSVELLHHDEDLIASFGGNAGRLKLVVFVIGGLLAGLSGALYAGYFGFVSPHGFSIMESFALALAVFIGGGGRLIGALAGILVYQCSFAVLGPDLSPYRFALLGAVVILTAHFFPQGLLPTKRELAALVPGGATRRAKKSSESQAADLASLATGAEVIPGELSVLEVTKRYRALTALDEVSLTIRPGSITALIGPNGAGKTTLLDIIAGDQLPTEGRVVLNGRDVTFRNPAYRAKTGIGRTYQKLRLVSSMTAIDVVLVGVDLAARREGSVTEATRRTRAREALALVGLEAQTDVTAGALTFGQRRLLEMARAIATRPRMLLLDEPSSGLDDSEVPGFADLIRRVHLTGCTIILVEHNLPFVQSVADEVVALSQGRLLAHGPAAEVFATPEFRESYLGEVVEA